MVCLRTGEIGETHVPCNDANQSAIDFHEDGRNSTKCPYVCNDANQSDDDFHENRRKSGKRLCACNENQIPSVKGHPAIELSATKTASRRPGCAFGGRGEASAVATPPPLRTALQAWHHCVPRSLCVNVLCRFPVCKRARQFLQTRIPAQT
jgi:hypothetical protein